MSLLRRRLSGLLSAAGLLALLVGGCTNETEPGPEAGTDYYPLALGDYRVYAVTDSVWVNYVLQPVATYQFRERVAEQITDAAGQPAYRLIRSKRVLPTDAWRDDTVMVISADSRTVQLTRNNRRTVELIFPVRAERGWNRNAFNAVDTSQANVNRRYVSVDVPFTATAAGQTFRYEHTLRTEDLEDVDKDNVATEVTKYRQVYARNSGPVFRQTRHLVLCEKRICPPGQVRIVSQGRTRYETLVEKGKM